MTVFEFAATALVGVVAGVVNATAGGGSLLTIPMLTFLGIPAMSANATLRPALVAQNVMALLGYRREGRLASDLFPWRVAITLAACAVPGALAGAWLVSTKMDDRELERLLAFIMVGCAVATLRRHGRREETSLRCHLPAAAAAFLALGAYGGFIQAGIGFLIIATLGATSSFSMATINAVKVFVVLAYTVPAAFVFQGQGLVDWTAAGALIVGHGVGGFLGSRLVSRTNDVVLRRVYVAAVLGFAVKLWLD